MNRDAWWGKAGLYTVAYGVPARTCAERLLKSWRQHMLGVPVIIATDEPDQFTELSTMVITPERPDIGAREPKLRVYDLTPLEWQYIMYLDADCEVLEPIDYFFDALVAGWEFVICKNPGKFASTQHMSRPNNREEVATTYEVMGGDDFLHMNGGVFSFQRNERTRRLFTDWLEGWKWQRNQDQPALHRAFHTNPLKMLVLGQEWNRSTRYEDGKEREIIRHFQTEARDNGMTKLSAGVSGDSSSAWRVVKQERIRRGEA